MGGITPDGLQDEGDTSPKDVMSTFPAPLKAIFNLPCICVLRVSFPIRHKDRVFDVLNLS
jgi:hypothetical protein